MSEHLQKYAKRSMQCKGSGLVTQSCYPMQLIQQDRKIIQVADFAERMGRHLFLRLGQAG